MTDTENVARSRSTTPGPKRSTMRTSKRASKRGSGPGPTRTSRVWGAVLTFTALLLVLLIFIAQNTDRVRITVFGVHPTVPLAVALLLSAVGGALLVGLAGVARVVQLRVGARRARAATPTTQEALGRQP